MRQEEGTMVVGQKRAIAGILGVLLVVAVTSEAADLGKTIASTEGRKRAAENGLKEIKSKSPQPSEQIRTAYVEAANKQNAWLDVVCQAWSRDPRQRRMYRRPHRAPPTRSSNGSTFAIERSDCPS
jgi:hypothetical protein